MSNIPIYVTIHHLQLSDALREFVRKKLTSTARSRFEERGVDKRTPRSPSIREPRSKRGQETRAFPFRRRRAATSVWQERSVPDLDCLHPKRAAMASRAD